VVSKLTGNLSGYYFTDEIFAPAIKETQVIACSVIAIFPPAKTDTFLSGGFSW
jgi:hypothetical protein